MKKISYKDSGVNIDEGNMLVNNLKDIVKTTYDNNVLGSIGGFSGGYVLPNTFKNPVIFAASDGVGTKLKIAIDSNRLDSIGIDLVAMCVNDLICNFATPLFFLDYYATAKLDKNNALKVIEGIAKGCIEAQCSLIGGESAEMPGMYKKNDFDLAGFAVGIASKDELDFKIKPKKNDTLIALPSSGIHSNGYSLVRKICFKELNLSFDYKIDNKNLIDILLTPTRIYTKLFKKLQHKIIALAHITGGGIIENLPRILPDNLGAKINKASIRKNIIFDFLSKYVIEEEMYRTFNMGVGMILVVDKDNVDYVIKNSDGYIIGEVTDNNTIELI